MIPEIKWKNKVEVLSGLRLILKLTNLYNKHGVYIGSVKIPNILVFFLVMLPVIWHAFLLLWAVVDEKFDLKLISNSLAVTIGNIQTTLAYVSLAMETDLVISTVDHLQEVVEKSELFF